MLSAMRFSGEVGSSPVAPGYLKHRAARPALTLGDETPTATDRRPSAREIAPKGRADGKTVRDRRGRYIVAPLRHADATKDEGYCRHCYRRGWWPNHRHHPRRQRRDQGCGASAA